MQMHNPAHPGRILAYYLEDRSVTEVARHLGVTRPALSRVLNGKAAVSAEMALRISEAFGRERCGVVRGHLPWRQKKGARMGHPATASCHALRR